MKAFAFAPLAAAILAPSAAALDPSVVAISHICTAEQVYSSTPGPRRLDFMPGMGSGGFAVRTRSAEAQKWFDYGLKLFHDFYHGDARMAFDKAVAADPDCALCRWGQALSRGPTVNFDIAAADEKAAEGLAQAALKAARTPQERALAQAMVDRYRAGQTPQAEEAFAAALLRAVASDPGKTDVRLIAAEALLTADRRGDHSGAGRAVAVLKPILKAQPDNSGAIHYYIHATEMAGHPADALPYAERLAALAPGSSHLIHMAGHTYMHVGRYEDVAALNARAIEVDAQHARATGLPGPLGAPDYYPHNLSFGLAGALMAGDGPLALKFATDARAAFPGKPSERADYTLARVLIAYGRYAPDKALALAEPDKSDAFGRTMWLYARGEADAARGEARAVLDEARQIGQALGARPDTSKIPLAVGVIAQHVLEGRADMLQGRPAEAAKAYSQAAALQERLHWGMDPPPWWYPVRRSVAAADLKAGRFADAVRESSASLKAWPGDALALKIRAEAERRLGQPARSVADEAAGRRAWHGELAAVPASLI